MQLLIAAAVAATSFLTQCYIKQLLCVWEWVSAWDYPSKCTLRAHKHTHTYLSRNRWVDAARPLLSVFVIRACFVYCLLWVSAGCRRCRVVRLQRCRVATANVTMLGVGWRGVATLLCFSIWRVCDKSHPSHKTLTQTANMHKHVCARVGEGVAYLIFLFFECVNSGSNNSRIYSVIARRNAHK